MFDEVKKDNGYGGESDRNNREYGGTVENGKVWLAKPGEVSDPTKSNQVFIMLPGGKSTFHSHPSGVRSDRFYRQSPSAEDRNTAGEQTHSVFGRGDKSVYIHDSKGVIAVVRDKYFVHPKYK